MSFPNFAGVTGALSSMAGVMRIIFVAPLVLAGAASAQQIVEETSTRFPSPNPTDWTNQVTIGDVDGDGDLDVLFANGGNFSTPGSPQVQRLYINDGSGNFADESSTRLGISGLCRGVELGDIDGDDDLDIIYAQDFNRVPILLVNDGDGFFTNVTTTQTPNIPLSSSRAQFGDIDNDGDLDLYIVSGTTSRFSCGQYRVYVNNGIGFFTDETADRHPIGLVCNNMDCIFGDIENDFDLDIRTGSTGNNNSKIYRNNGAGVFTAAINVPADTSCYSYDFGDMDGDGDLDLVGANGGNGNNTEMLMINDGTGRYTNVSNRIIPNPNQDDNDSKFFDYDNDGDLDLIIARLGSGGEKVYNNNGSGVFSQVTGIIAVVSDSSLDIMVADLTGNGALDVVTGQGESGSYQNRIYVNSGPADTIAPRIIRTEQQDDTADTAGPYVIRALILDDMSSDRNFFDKGITLNYSIDGGSVLEVPMRHSGGQVYRGEIPGQPLCSDVSYFVTARDFANNLGTGDTLMFAVKSAGDIDGDDAIGFQDLLMMLAAWGPCAPPPEVCLADLDCDGIVGFQDLLILLSNWS